MTPTPGSLRQFAAHEHKEEQFCLRMSKKIGRFIKFSKSATEHRRLAESAMDFLKGEYHNVECR